MSNTMQTLTIEGTQAINLQNISLGGSAPSVIFPKDGQVAVTMTSSVCYHYETLKLNQAFLFNCAPVDSGCYNEWFSIANTSTEVIINVKANQPVYAFIVDQITTLDNTGFTTLTFTPINIE